jgi:replicative DNA helicase
MNASEQTEARYCRRIEAAAIGGLILNPRKLDDVRPWLDADDFTVAHYGRWYTYICDLRDAGRPIDQVTLLTELRRHDDLGPDGRYAVELATITERVPIPGEPAYYARTVLEESTRRQLRIAGLHVAQVAQHGDLADVFADALVITESVRTLHRRLSESAPGAARVQCGMSGDEPVLRHGA